MPVNRESCELLRAIARSSDAEQMHRLALNVHNWDSLFNLAQQHRMSSMLFLRLVDMGTAVPPAVQKRIRAEYERNMFHNLANAVELIAVLKAFERESIPAMPFKGVVLAASVYRDLTTRPAGDLDLLINYEHLTRATTILLNRGYELHSPTLADGTPAIADYYEYHFERSADGMVFELRWRLELTQPRFHRNLGMDWIWPKRKVAVLAGAEVPDIDREILLLILCMHGSKHAWSRLIWICDIAQLLRSSPELDWKEVLDEGSKQGLSRVLTLGILLAHLIANAPVPETILQRFETDVTARSLAQYFDENLFEAPGSTPQGRVPYHLQLLDTRDRLRFFFSFNSLRPNERDKAVLLLPKPLYPFYFLIRPFRLLRDRSAR